MKTALCLSGLPRGLIECSPSIIENIIKPNNCDVFVHTWWDPATVGSLYRNRHPKFTSRVLDDIPERIKDIYQPKMNNIDLPKKFDTKDVDSIYQPGDTYFLDAIQSMFYSIFRSNQLRISYEYEHRFGYDAVCRCRFDMIINKPIIFNDLNLSKVNIKNDCKHEVGCCNDHIAVSSRDNMNIYSYTHRVIRHLYRNGCPFAGETLLGRWLKENNIEITDGRFDYRLLEAT